MENSRTFSITSASRGKTENGTEENGNQIE